MLQRTLKITFAYQPAARTIAIPHKFHKRQNRDRKRAILYIFKTKHNTLAYFLFHSKLFASKPLRFIFQRWCCNSIMNGNHNWIASSAQRFFSLRKWCPEGYWGLSTSREVAQIHLERGKMHRRKQVTHNVMVHYHALSIFRGCLLTAYWAANSIRIII